MVLAAAERSHVGLKASTPPTVSSPVTLPLDRATYVSKMLLVPGEDLARSERRLYSGGLTRRYARATPNGD